MLAEIELKKERSESIMRTWELAEAFHPCLANCTKKGTCDIHAAHHEALKDDLIK